MNPFMASSAPNSARVLRCASELRIKTRTPASPPCQDELLLSVQGRVPTPDVLDASTVLELMGAGLGTPWNGPQDVLRCKFIQGFLFLLRARSPRQASPSAQQDLSECLSVGVAIENVVLAAHHRGLFVELIHADRHNALPFYCAFAFYRKAPSGSLLECHDFDYLSAYTEAIPCEAGAEPAQLSARAERKLMSASHSIPGVRLQLAARAPLLSQVCHIIHAHDIRSMGDQYSGHEPRLVGLLSVQTWSPWEFLRAGRALQRLRLTCAAQGFALQPWTRLPTLYARAFVLARQGLSVDEITLLNMLWEPYSELFGLSPITGQAFLFELSQALSAPRAADRKDA